MKTQLQEKMKDHQNLCFKKYISYSKQDKTKMLFKTILMFGYDLADFGQYVPEDDVFYPSAVLKKDKNYTKENYSCACQ